MSSYVAVAHTFSPHVSPHVSVYPYSAPANSEINTSGKHMDTPVDKYRGIDIYKALYGYFVRKFFDDPTNISPAFMDKHELINWIDLYMEAENEKVYVNI